MASEKPYRQLAELECVRRGWKWYDPTFYGYKSKREKFPRCYDFHGVVDLLAVHQGRTYAIQFTSRPNAAARRKKIQANVQALEFFEEGD